MGEPYPVLRILFYFEVLNMKNSEVLQQEGLL